MLDDEPFDARERKDGGLDITYRGRHIMTVSPKKAAKIIARLQSADRHTYQLILAKATGNFKHGNERPSSHP